MAKQRKYAELSALKGKIREEKTTYEEVSNKLGMGINTFSNKINGHVAFNANEMHDLVEILNIDLENITKYFFPDLLQKSTNLEEGRFLSG